MPEECDFSKLRLQIAWTTVESAADADSLAAVIIESGLAACVQIDGPIRSVYTWKGRLETGSETRLWIKFPQRNATALWKLVDRMHPYEVPQWVVIETAAVAEAYANWVEEITRH